MIRTHIYLTEEQNEDIKRRAQLERRRESDVTRELIDRGRFVTRGRKQETVGQAMLRLVDLGKQLGENGPTDLSTNHDDYLYGDKQ